MYVPFNFNAIFSTTYLEIDFLAFFGFGGRLFNSKLVCWMCQEHASCSEMLVRSDVCACSLYIMRAYVFKFGGGWQDNKKGQQTLENYELDGSIERRK
jgi:hypothetical protein